MMGKVNFVMGRTTDAGDENERLSSFAKDLVHFASESQEKVVEFSKKLENELGKERLVQGANKAVDKIVDILNQFLMVAGQRHELATLGCLVSNLGLFLMLLQVQVDVASVLIFAVFNESFRSCQKAKRLGTVAVNVGDCLRFLEARFGRMENFVVESAEIMYRIGGLAHANDDVRGPFQRLRTSIDSARMESVKADEKVAETFAVIRKILISPGRRKLIIQVATVLGGVLGFCCSLVITWFLSWFVAVITILLGTTAFAILGAILGFKIVNRKETNLLEHLVRCSNQRDYLRKSFENFKYKLQNSELYVKYAHHGNEGRQVFLQDGVDIPLNDFTEC